MPTICQNLSRAELQSLKAEAYIRYYTQKDRAAYAGIIDTYKREIENLKVSGDWQLPGSRNVTLSVAS